jgi:hypothetical protein
MITLTLDESPSAVDKPIARKKKKIEGLPLTTAMVCFSINESYSQMNCLWEQLINIRP